jgi:hypothetical protein
MGRGDSTVSTVCVFHANCQDGHAAAWAVRSALGDIEFHAGKYGAAPPDCTGKDVILVDFSYSRPVLMDIAKQAKSVLLLDHHLTAFQEIGNVEKAVSVPLSNGQFAFVDAADAGLVSDYSWSAHVRGGAVAYTGGGRADPQFVYMHQLILPPKEGFVTDHVNRDTFDNRRGNLRYATKAQNGMNMDRGGAYKGITKRDDRWLAQITIDGKNKYIGSFPTEEAAAKAYDEAARAAFGEFARCSFGGREMFPPNCHFIFDMTRSGAGLAWGYFHRGTPPALIQHVEDRDLWQFKDSNTKAYCAGLSSYPMTFTAWDTINKADPREIIREGRAILRYQAQRLAEVKPLAFRANIGGYDVPIVNAPYFMASELAGELAAGETFAATYFETDKGVTFSLRSRDGFDVSAVAKLYGGGGHAGAAGFTILHPDGPPQLVPSPGPHEGGFGG